MLPFSRLRRKKSRELVFAQNPWKKDEKNFFFFSLNTNALRTE